MSTLTESLARTLIDATLQGALLLAGALLLVLLLRRRLSAAALHLGWTLGIAGLLAVWTPLPSALRWRPTLSAASTVDVAPALATREVARARTPGAPVEPTAEERVASAPPIVDALPTAPGLDPEPARTPLPHAATPAPKPAAAWLWHRILVATWLAGVLVTLTSCLLALRRVRALVRSARPCRVALPADLAAALARRRVRLLESERVRVPMTAGALRPVILVPRGFAGWPGARQRLALVHELAHVERGDWLLRLLARVAVALHWFDPLAWLVERRMRLESEHACDDAVLAAGDESADYAAGLLDIARGARGTRPPVAAIALAGGPQLEQRLRAILDPARRRGAVGRSARWLALGATLGAGLALSGLAVARALPPRGAQEVLTVATDGSAQYTSIQAAIDAAGEGATVRIAAGTYEEAVTIDKPLTLEGAGWETTRVSVPYPDISALNAALASELQKAGEAGASGSDLRALRDAYLREHGPRPALYVKPTTGVVVRGLSFSMRGEAQEGSVLPGAVVDLLAAQARIEDCAVLGSPASGVTISSDSKVELRRCLVAGVDATGIAISGPEPEVVVAECDVRNCRHRGITVGGNAKTTIERCRISGSAWHGIRYDDAAPKVLGNLIFANERCGIYASGKTHGEVRGNLFFRNEMTGISCWFQAADRIEGNTFVGDVRSAVEVIGAATPVIHGNVFSDLAQAVALGNTSGDAENARSTGEVDLADNLYWNVERRAVAPGGKEDLPVASTGGNREADPRFVAPDERDYSLAQDSPARAAGIGASDPLAFESPWPLQPEERPHVERREAEAQRAASQATTQDAWTLARPWIDDLMQIQDRARRDAAVETVRAALASDDPVRQHAGLIAFVQTGQATYERASFRKLLLPLVGQTSGDVQVSAFYALNLAGLQAGDEKLLLGALRVASPQLADSGLHLLMLYFKGRLEGEAAEAALALLPSGDGRSGRQGLNGIWGAFASPELQERLLALAAKPDLHHDIVYFALSTLQNKSRPVVEYLIGLVDGPDSEDAWRSLWGLQQGVAEPERPLVADVALKLFVARNSPQTRDDCLWILRNYGDATHLPALRELAANDMLPESTRAELQDAIDAIEKH